MLFVTDLHGSEQGLRWLVQEAINADAVIIGGDVTTWGDLGFIERLFGSLLGVSRPVYFVPGNHEPRELRPPPGLTYLHAVKVRLGSLWLGGLGGSSVTPFDTPFEMADAEARSLLSALGSVDILVSHCPPHGTRCDLASIGRHIGSLPVREYAEASEPRLILCGHVHEAIAKDKIRGVEVVNPGALMAGRYALVEISEEVRAELKSVPFDEWSPNGQVVPP